MTDQQWLDTLPAQDLQGLRDAGIADAEIVGIAKASHELSHIKFEPYDPSVENRRTLATLGFSDK